MAWALQLVSTRRICAGNRRSKFVRCRGERGILLLWLKGLLELVYSFGHGLSSIPTTRELRSVAGG